MISGILIISVELGEHGAGNGFILTGFKAGRSKGAFQPEGSGT